jgi:hypothetical protein
MENQMNQENKLQATEAVIANVISEAEALKPEQADQAFNCGMRSAKLKVSNVENLNAYASTLGKNPSYATYEACRIQWVSGYVSENPNNTGEAADKAFHTFAKQLKELFGLDKPSSGNPAAKKKAEQREKKTNELLAAYQDKTVSELSKQLETTYETLAKQPSNKEAEKKAAELKKVIKTKKADSNKQQAALLKELKADAMASIKDCDNVELLEQVIELLA